MENAENSEVLEVAPPEAQSNELPVQEAPITEVKSSQEDRQERNWAAFRTKQKELENELRMQKEMNEKLLQMQLANQPSPKKEIDELEEIGDSEYIPKGQVKKLVQRERDQIVKQTLEEVDKRNKEREQSQFLDRLRRQYSDFDEIVNPETLAILEVNDPELAATIAESKDPYKVGVQSYKYIKAMNLTSQVQNSRRAKEVEKKLDASSKTVQTPQAYEKRPMAQAFQMTEAEKSKLYEEMTTFARQSGFSY